MSLGLDTIDDIREWLEGEKPCLYFALCENPAEGYVVNPIVGMVPTCKRCVDRVGETLIEIPIEIPTEES